MNTKILVALVIGIALVGLTGAASACCGYGSDHNTVYQKTESCSALIGQGNGATQTSSIYAAISGDSDYNYVKQEIEQCALAIGKKNTLFQTANQNVEIDAYYNKDSDYNTVYQKISQAELAFGKRNRLTEVAGQDTSIKSSDWNYVNQDISQVEMAFGVGKPCLGRDIDRSSNDETLDGLIKYLGDGKNNGASQKDWQTVSIMP